jgi:hypothetical protein
MCNTCKPKSNEPQPFDLEAAKQGAPIMWNLSPVYFVAHVPEARVSDRLVLRTERGTIVSMPDAGHGLYMAPKPPIRYTERVYLKRTPDNRYFASRTEGLSYVASVDVEFTIGQFAR